MHRAGSTGSTIEELFQHDAFVRRLARSLVRDEHLAEDVVQQTYQAALGAHPPRDRARVRSWLASVVRNLARLHARGAARRRRLEETSARPELLPATAYLIERVDLHRRVVAAALDLPEPYRSVLLLRHFEELSHAEIAARVGVPLETMRTRLKRAHTLLRHRLERDFPGDESRLHAGLAGLASGAASGAGSSGLLEGSVEASPSWMGASGVGAHTSVFFFVKGVLMNVALRLALLAALVLGVAGWYLLPDSTPSPTTHAVSTDGQDTRAVPSPIAPAANESTAPSRQRVHPEAEKNDPALEHEPTFAQASETVDCVVSGVVLDDLDVPIPGARVALHDQPGDGLAASRALAEVETDGDGRFEFSRQSFHGRHSRAAVFVTADDYAIGGSTFGIPAVGPVVVRLARKTSLVGRVLAAEGGPIGAARVTFDSIVMPGEAGFEWMLVPEVLQADLAILTDANGYFSVDRLPRQRTVNLRVDAEGYASWRGPVVLSGSDRSGPLEISLQAGAAIRGTVTFADGSPVRGVRVGAQAWDETSPRLSWSEGETAVDDTGAYALTGLGPGRWNVFVDLPEHAQREWATPARDGVELFPGVSTEGVDFVLTEGARISIVAADAETGGPVPGVYVGIVSRARPQSGAAVQGVMTDHEGRGSIRVPAGEARAYLMSPPEGYSGNGGESFELAEGEEQLVELWLSRTPVVRGRVVDEYERPVAGARVWSITPFNRGLGENAKTTTDHDGWFEFPSSGHGLALALRADAEGLAMPAPYVVRLATGEPIELRLQAKPTGALIGRVLQPNGFPAAGAQVDLIERADLPDEFGVPYGSPTTRADAEGRFAFHGIWPGSHYAVTVSWRDPQVVSDQAQNAWASTRSAAREAIGGVTLDLGDVALRRDPSAGGSDG